MGSVPSSRLTKILQEKAELLKKRRQGAELYLKEVDAEVKGLAALGIELPDLADREVEVRTAYRRSDWDAAEEKAKELLDYVSREAGPGLAAARLKIAERAIELTRLTGQLPDDLSRLIKESGEEGDPQVSAATIEHVAAADRALRTEEERCAENLTSRAYRLADWAGDAAQGDREALHEQFEEALAPAKEGRLTEASRRLNDQVRTSLPKATERRDRARAAAEALLGAADDLSVPASELAANLRLDSDASPLDWPESVARLESGNAELADALRGRVVAAIDSLRATLVSLREYGVDPAPNLAQVEEAASQVPEATPARLPELLNLARSATEEPVVAVVASLVDEVRPRLVEVRRLGRDATDVFAAMNRAREALRLKIYSEALAAAQEAVDRVVGLTSDVDTAREEVTSLERLLTRLEAARFPVAPYRQALLQATQALDRMDVPAARASLQEAIRSLGREALSHFSARLSTLERVAAEARRLGFLPPETPGELGHVRELLESGQFVDAGELLAAAEVRLRAAAGPYVSRRVEELSQGFQEIPDAEMVGPLRRLLADADVNLRVKEDLPAALDSLQRTEREFSAVVAAHASALVESLEEERRALEAMGGAGDELQVEIDEVQQIFNMGDFVKASRASQEIRTRALQLQLVRSEETISHAKLALVELGKMGLDTTELRSQLESAMEAARNRRFPDAYRSAQGVLESATRLRSTAQETLDLLAEAMVLLQNLKQAGVAIDSYRTELEGARAAYRSLDLKNARTTVARVTDALIRDRCTLDAREMIGQCDALVEDATRLGVPTETFYPKLGQVKELLATGHAVEARAAIEPLRAELVRHLRPVLEENLRSIERDLEVARSAGLQTPEVIAGLGEARRILHTPVPVGAAERLEAARAHLIETRGFLEHAERALARAREALNQAELVRVDVGGARARMERLDVHLAQREYPRVIELSSALERELSQATHQQVAKTLAGFHGMLVRLGKEGTETTLASELLQKARTALDEGRPLEALRLAAQSEGELERVELQLRIAQASLETIEGKLGGAVSHGVKVPQAQAELAQARQAFQLRHYPEVLERVFLAADLITISRDQYRRAREALDSADRQVKEAMELGAEVHSVLAPLERSRGNVESGAYIEAMREAREAAEAAREAIDRLYRQYDVELRGLLETARAEGVEVSEVDRIARPLDMAEAAIKTREWRRASEQIALAREAGHAALDPVVGRRGAELETRYAPDADVDAEELTRRTANRNQVAEAAARHDYPRGFALLKEETARVESLRATRYRERLAALESGVWIGERLGLDTTPIMELFSEAKLAIDSGNLGSVPDLLERANRQLDPLVGQRVQDKARDLSTELVFAQEGLHVSVGPVPEMLAKAEERRAAGAGVESARLVLEAEEELNRRKSSHRELLNLQYLIEAALVRGEERGLDLDEPRRLLDESIQAKATDYAVALEKAREALTRLHGALREAAEPSATVWPFRSPPPS